MPKKKTLFEDTDTPLETMAQDESPVVDVTALQSEIEALKADSARLRKQIDDYNSWLLQESELIEIPLVAPGLYEMEFYLDPFAVSGVRIDMKSHGIRHRVSVYINHGADCFGLTLEQWDMLRPKLLTARKKRTNTFSLIHNAATEE